MPKMKTHSGAKKRLRFTANGHVRRPHAYHQHNFRHKTTKQNRQLRKTALLQTSEESRVRKLLPYL